MEEEQEQGEKDHDHGNNAMFDESYSGHYYDDDDEHGGDMSESQHSHTETDGDHHHMDDSLPFFADMTLDLAEAHDIAETPELKQRTIIEPRQLDIHQLSQPAVVPTMMTTSTSPTSPTSIGNNNNNNNFTPTSMSTPENQLQSQDLDDGQAVQFQGHNPQDGTATMADDDDNTNTSSKVMYGRVTSSDPGIVMSARNSYASGSGASNVMMMRRGTFGGSRRTKLWTKDVTCAVCFVVVVPIALIGPLVLLNKNDQEPDRQQQQQSSSSSSWLATGRAPKLATFHTLLWGFAASIVLARFLYRTAGGGDGDDARHFASQILLASAPISVSVYIFLLVAIYWLVPHGTWMFSLIPLWCLSRDVYLFRRWKMTATTPGGRQSFFQALTCMTLDILSRSLRRLPFWRCVIATLIVQFFLIAWWRIALLAAIKSGSVFWIILTAGGGKWATGTVARLMSLIASGGIANWFGEQSTLLLEMQEQNQQLQQQDGGESTQEGIQGQSSEGDGATDTDLGFANIPKDYSRDYDYDGVLPEAYRSADASAYRSVVQFDDEGIDDDMSDDEDDDEAPSRFYPRGSDGPPGNKRHSFGMPTSPSHQRRPGSSVKQLVGAGLTVSFGSVAKCGLLGGVAQFLWSQIRKIDHARATIRGLRGIEIQGSNFGQPEPQGLLKRIMKSINGRARIFVQNNSDMAMSFVAQYQMAYSPASREVALVLDERGVEPIIHDDISTHISSCVGASISGLIVVFTGAILVHQRNSNSPTVPDTAVVLDMLLAFIFCYTLIFTAMEPLRASIKAVYVSFAQHPESLKASFPLIYHRLSRMSQSNRSLE